MTLKMKNSKEWLFQAEISDWESWGSVFQQREAFSPLMKYIFAKERLLYSEVENCTPGTNAVFKVGNYIVKIFAPKESGLDTDSDYETEIYGIRRANHLGLSVPKLVSFGSVEDKYLFHYLIMEYVDGKALGDISATLSNEEKYSIGSKLRKITDELNTQVEPFNSVDIVKRGFTNERWKVFSPSFNNERIKFLHQYKCENMVFVHGDINPDNVLLDKGGEIYIIDFADGVLAPIVYEHALIATELFRFDPDFLHGYFGELDLEEITDICCTGLLLHDFGADVLADLFSDTKEITTIAELRSRLLEFLNVKKFGK